MKKKIKYLDDFEGLNIADQVRVPDWLPPLKELAGTSKKKKITIELEVEDIEFFKKQAKKLGASYQQMIRNLVSRYANSFKH